MTLKYTEEEEEEEEHRGSKQQEHWEGEGNTGRLKTARITRESLHQICINKYGPLDKSWGPKDFS